MFCRSRVTRLHLRATRLHPRATWLHPRCRVFTTSPNDDEEKVRLGQGLQKAMGKQMCREDELTRTILLDYLKAQGEIIDKDAVQKKPTIRSMVAQYGPVFMVYWTLLWGSNFLLVYGALEYTALSEVIDVPYILDFTGLSEHVSPSAGNAAVAVALNEALEIARFPFTVATTPSVARALNR